MDPQAEPLSRDWSYTLNPITLPSPRHETPSTESSGATFHPNIPFLFGAWVPAEGFAFPGEKQG